MTSIRRKKKQKIYHIQENQKNEQVVRRENSERLGEK